MFWHVTEIAVPVFFAAALLYSVRWRIALIISDRLSPRRAEANQVENEISTDHDV
jgi:hypothetical protein